MSAWITYRRDRVKYVKNLGWLLRNWQKVQRMTVEREISRPGTGDMRLTVSCRWGHSSDRYGEEVTYTCIFADSSVLQNFLDRPVFRDLWIKWMDKSMQIGSAEYRAMKRCPIEKIVKAENNS